MEGAVLSVMNAGLRRLEAHPLLAGPPTPASLPSFVAHSLVFARAFGRLLERRVARTADRDAPALAAIARVHLRIHQPFPRALEAELGRQGKAREALERLTLPPAGQVLIDRAERALAERDLPAAHALLLSGLECMSQLLARRGVDLLEAAGAPLELFERRHDGHESLLFMGLRELSSWPEARTAHVPEALSELFEDAAPWLDAWREGPPPEQPRGRARRRPSAWATGDLPTDVA